MGRLRFRAGGLWLDGRSGRGIVMGLATWGRIDQLRRNETRRGDMEALRVMTGLITGST